MGDYIASIREKLCELLAQGDMCLDKEKGFSLDGITQPNFKGLDGLQAQLGGTQGSAIFINENGDVSVNLYDTFGVDFRDAVPEDWTARSAFYSITGGAKGLKAFYVLQHVHGYPALVHKVPVDYSTLGLQQININDCD